MKFQRPRWTRDALVVALAVLPAATPLSAGAQQLFSDTAVSATGHPTAVFTKHDALTAAAFVLGTAAVMPLDRHIAVESQRPSLQNNAALRHTTTAIRVIGEPGAIVFAGATYIYGRAEDSPRSAELGLRTLESIGAAGITTYLIKGIAGRARPYVGADTVPHDYKFGRGFRDDNYTSFPSGHVTTAFAAASAASQEIGYLWPHASHLWTPLLFTSASLVGVARIYEDKHWASDVVAGAAVGTIVSRIVVHYTRAHPRDAIDRVLLPVGVSKVNGARAMTFNWNYQW
jgi:membrane-associated phospholipid phosphatase